MTLILILVGDFNINFLSLNHTLFPIIKSPLYTSDHLGVSIIYKAPTSNKRPSSFRRSVWCYSHADFDKACNMLQDVDWVNLMGDPDVNVCWRAWQSTSLDVMDLLGRVLS